ncbi:MAG: ATP-binding cassette domain-containing protein [Paramuribaculum sp.]|nr:ATP-binding cassette domain-containing protein [Paramuribaculum sp.]
MKPLINLNSDQLQYIGVSLENPYHAVIPQGVTVIAGPNGAGKSTLTRILERGWNFTRNSISSPFGKLDIKRIEFSDIHTLTGFKAEYYQQRYEASMNDEVPAVEEILACDTSSPRWQKLSEALGIQNILGKKANYLSSGELRKVLVARMISSDMPDVLILDNPYIGLDAKSRKIFDSALEEVAESGVSIILAVSDPAEIPDYADAVIPVKNLTVGTTVYRDNKGIDRLRSAIAPLFSFAIDGSKIPSPAGYYAGSGDELVNLDKCTVAYGKKVILPEISWVIRRGEHWALSGPNGSGKSTLLSLIHADNPKVYSNNVKVFGRRRGTGESIWDVKKRIGYISPEMHLYFGGGTATVRENIARGLNDTVGFYTRLLPEQLEKADRWIKLLHLEDIADKRFNTLSSGEQRMTLLARTFIKNPELMILDEPMHGLDSCRKKAIKSIINSLACRDNTTIIFVTHNPDELPECITHSLTLRGSGT